MLDLDETLVHSIAETGKSLIRPYAELFLRELAPFYEIIIFTAAVKDYADNLLDSIDKEKQWIKYRLYRQHTTIMNNANVKDIGKLGRDLKRVIIIELGTYETPNHYEMREGCLWIKQQESNTVVSAMQFFPF